MFLSHCFMILLYFLSLVPKENLFLWKCAALVDHLGTQSVVFKYASASSPVNGDNCITQTIELFKGLI